MLPKLLKFIIRTRFSRPFIILITLLLVYALAVSTFVPRSQVTTIFGSYAIGIIALFLGMALATGGVMVMKSDRDYLFTLPLSSRDLSISIFFAQFVAFGTTVLLISVYLVPAITSPLFAIDIVALALVLTSLGVIAPAFQTRTRITLSIALALWTLLAFANFPFTPGSAFNGNLYGGTATLLALAAVTVVAAFRGLSRVELDMMKSLVRTTSADIKSPNSYAGKSPMGAIYSMNLSNMSLAGRVNMAGTSRYVSKRVKTWWVVAAATAAAIGYFGATLLLGGPAAFGGVGEHPLSVIFLAIGLGYLGFFFSQSAITNERIWLSLTALPAASYFRHLVASKLLSFMLVLVPFAVADAVLWALGYGAALGTLAVIVLVIPSTFILEICWAAYIAPIQIKGDDMMMPAQFSIRQLVTVLPLVLVILFAAGSSISPFAAFVGGIILCTLSVTLVLSSGFWGRVVTKLTENGFV